MKLEKSLLYVLMTGTAILSFCFSCFKINISLHHHFQQLVWLSDNSFINHYLSFAGGLGEYVTLFFSQFFVINWLGSLISSVLAFMVSFLIYKIADKKWGKINYLYFIIPLIQVIFLALLCSYSYPFSVTVNVFFISLMLYLCSLKRNVAGKGIPFLSMVGGAFLYYISGGTYFLVFMVSSIFLHLEQWNKSFFLTTFLLLSETILLPLIAFKYVFQASLFMSYFHSLPLVATMLRYPESVFFYVGLGFIPVILILLIISNQFSHSVNGKETIPLVEKGGADNRQKNFGTIFSISKKEIVVVLLVVLGFIAVSFGIIHQAWQPTEKLKMEIDYFATQREWDKIIVLSAKLDSYDRMSNFQYNRALANTGQILEKLFDREQLLGSQGLFLDKPFAPEVALPCSDLYFDLGNIDESQRYAFESQTLMANSTRVIKRLVMNCMIMRNYEAAATYLNAIDDNPMEKKWTSKYKYYLNDLSLAENDQEIMNKRINRCKEQSLFVSPRTMLISQLQKNPMNKMAFEYLIAFDLMEHDLASLIEDMEFFAPMNYKTIPKVLEEAILLFRSQRKDIGRLNGLKISNETYKKFTSFASLTQEAKGDKNKAKQTTLEFKNTYWYYVLFDSPLVTNIQVETKPVSANY